jgi:glycosyltransferase involved in cell wall biosynthesis
MNRSAVKSTESSPLCGRRATKVLVVGQTPPPYFGQAVAIEQLVTRGLDDVQLIHVRMNFTSSFDEMGRFRISKVLHMLSVVVQIIYHRFADRVRVLYYPPAGSDRVPMYRDIFILFCTRWLFDKTIFHFHAGGVSELYDRLPPWQRWLFRRAYFGADAAIRISDLNPEDGRRLAAQREYVVPNGIVDPSPEWSNSPALAAEGRGLRMLFVGILSEAKGVMVLIEGCANLAARGVPFELELMGQWESEDFAARAQSRIKELGLAKQIRLLGVLTGERKYDAFRRANAFCFPTHFQCETFGLVLLEAMAFGLPVVATRWRGIPSIVDEGQTGLLFEPRDFNALADRLATLSGDAPLRERMGRAGRAKFEREFTFDRHASRMRNAILETAGVSVEESPERVDDRLHVAPIVNRSYELQLQSRQ